MQASQLTVTEFMTRPVQTIGTKHTLAQAHRLMNAHLIRHLPVVEHGQLVGLVSQRDLHLLESLKGVDPEVVTVEEAMSQDTFVVDPDERLAEVARRMREHKYGSAVVLRGPRVLGIFTTTDALRALQVILSGDSAPAGAGASP